MALNKKQLTELRSRLEEIRDRGRADRQSLAELTEGLAGASSGDLSNAPVHLADKGTEEFLHGMGTVLLGNEESIVADATEALRRMDEGEYGDCEGRGASIPLERLRAVPATRFCLACAESGQAQSPSLDFNEGRPRLPSETLMGGGSGSDTIRNQLDGLGLGAAAQRAHARDGAAGTPGGGAAGGGLAGGNYGHGDPLEGEIEAEMEGGRPDRDESEDILVKADVGSTGTTGDEPTTRQRPRKRAK